MKRGIGVLLGLVIGATNYSYALSTEQIDKINNTLRQGETIVKFENRERSDFEGHFNSFSMGVSFPSTFGKPLIYINYPKERKFGYRFYTSLNKENILKSYTYVDEIIDMIPKEFNDLEKIEFVYRYIALLPYVDKNEERDTSNQYAYSLFNGGAVCAAKADLVNALLNKMGIPTKFVVIEPKDGVRLLDSRHAINLVYYDGAWYYLDSTFAGSGGVLSHEKESVKMGFNGYRYFMFGEKEFDEIYEMVVEKGSKLPKNISGTALSFRSEKEYVEKVKYNRLYFSPKDLRVLKQR